MKGVVMRSTGSFYDVLGEDGKRHNCRVRGKIRLEGIKETNPVAVGDRVAFELDHEIGSIVAILPRENHILRQSVKKTGHSHVLAANVDQVLLVVTLAFPRTSLGFIDRFLVAAESFRIPQILVFNKQDLLGEEEQRDVAATMEMYRAIGVRCFAAAAAAGQAEGIAEALSGKTTLVAGHSGVGKSTLLNYLFPGSIEQSTGEVSSFSSKGTHTTTFAEMFQVNPDTFVIDTPGVKELGLFDMVPQELSDYFPEMRELRNDCRFGARCIHVNEPKCAVIDAVHAGRIAVSRYQSYLSMVLNEDKRR